ncbi:MAG: hypothetical protein V4565_00830 [Bacteroidota bacterium]
MLTLLFPKINFFNLNSTANNRCAVLLTLLFLFLIQTLVACDVCGNYMGITPYDNKNSISFLHRYRVFNGYVNHQSQSSFFPKSAYRVAHADEPQDSMVTKNYSSHDFESYKIIELRFKYFVSNRIEMNVFLPFLDNKSKTDNYLIHNNGFGDVSLNAGFHVITPKADQVIRHKLITGTGIKLPTGNIYATNNKGDRLPFEMQAGTGSWDGFLYGTYVFMTKRIGGSVSLNYKINGKNSLNERLSNSHNDFASLFYKMSFKDLILYSSIQANYEQTNGLQINDQQKFHSPVNSWLMGPGLDIYYKSFSLNMIWHLTVTEKVSEGNLNGAGRITVGMNYSFSNREKS